MEYAKIIIQRLRFQYFLLYLHTQYSAPAKTMYSKLKWMVTFCCLAMFSAFGQQNVPHHFNEVVLEIKNFSAVKNVPQLSTVLAEYSVDSYVYITCEQSGWVVLRIETSQVVSMEHLESILKNASMDYIIKSGATSKEVIAACDGDIKKY